MYKPFSFLVTLVLASSLPAGTAIPASNSPATMTKPVVAQTSDEVAAREYFTDLELVNQNGEAVRFYTDVLKDRVVLINFVFTHCQDACPLITRKLRTARDMLDEAVSARVYFISISIDPERDTPAALQEFATKFNVAVDNWVFLTGDKENVNHIVKKLGQFTPEVEEHSTLILAGNVRDRHWVKIPPTVPPVGIAEKLRLLAEGG
jgi:cytochrome oxidase Cu insertion factor (SCO1/SenC/PrrC family)